jgi:predicted Fe-Mo cluster-binding NifX family protein
MKIAVASQDKKHITGHTGKCQKFWIYMIENEEIRSKEILEVPKEQSFHHSSPHEPHPLDGIQVLIGGSMGQGLMGRLKNMGIQGIITPETDPDTAIIAYLQGCLISGDPDNHNHDHSEEN